MSTAHSTTNKKRRNRRSAPKMKLCENCDVYDCESNPKHIKCSQCTMKIFTCDSYDCNICDAVVCGECRDRDECGWCDCIYGFICSKCWTNQEIVFECTKCQKSLKLPHKGCTMEHAMKYENQEDQFISCDEKNCKNIMCYRCYYDAYVPDCAFLVSYLCQEHRR